jgi:arabinogalactan endo-1,4-beta-galactosidase
MANRAKNLGFRIMLDFHYSDTWADPGHQTKPAAWANHTISQLITDVYNHTYDVLDTMKTLGITPEWVQVGNETSDGLLWPEGQASVHMDNYASLITSGYNAVKAINNSINVIVHISNGFDNSLYRWIFDGLKNNSGKYDVIGMSLYPSTSNWSTLNSQCLVNMNDMVSRYGKQIMICEVGMDHSAAATCKSFIVDLITKTASVSGGLGLFYWEPEAYNWQNYGLGAWDPVTMEPTIAMDAFSTPITDVKNQNVTGDVSVFPNPNMGEFLNIDLNGLTGTSVVKIFDENGKLMHDQTFTDQNKIDMYIDLKSGIYVVKIHNKQQEIIRKLVIK